jgi:hypothetical protein
MCNDYRKFIINYSSLAHPLTELTKKGTPFQFSQEALDAFEELKKKLCEDVIFQMTKKFYVFIDASNFAIGGILAQKDGSDLRPIEFVSC